MPQANLQPEIERLLPQSAEDIVEVSSIDEYYQHSHGPDRWNLFQAPDQNYALYRADFIMHVEPFRPSPRLFILDSSATDRTHVTVDAFSGGRGLDEEDPESVMLLTRAYATLVRPSMAKSIGGRLLVPTIEFDFFNIDGTQSGYGGSTYWSIVGNDQRPEDVFSIPRTTPTISRGGEKRGEPHVPELGIACAGQMLGFGGMLSEVQPSHHVTK